MKKLRLLLISTLLIIVSNTIFAKSITQTIRGQVIEKKYFNDNAGCYYCIIGNKPANWNNYK